MDMKRFFLYFMVIAALALAGCGGNGGGATTPDPAPTPDPMPTPTGSVDLSGLLMGYGLTADDAGEYKIAAGGGYGGCRQCDLYLYRGLYHNSRR